jgi:large subunit ribosomal protein L18e
MTIKRNSKNNQKKEMIEKLYLTYKAKKKDVYKRLAELLNVSSRTNISVNLAKLEKLKNVVNDSIVVVPGKILGVGILNKNINIYAYSFSKTAKDKVKSLKSLDDFCKDNINYKKVVLIR